MGIVTYNQRGYNGCSMSWGAEAAYEDGEMPKSKWTKAAMLQAINDWCIENDAELDLSSLKKDELFDKFFCWSSWHHTGKFANVTDFYCLNEAALEEAVIVQ